MQKPPKIELEDIDITSFPITELKYVHFDKIKWFCCVNGCNRHSHVKDYGAVPNVLFRNKWINITSQVFYCTKHWPLFRKNIHLPLKSFNSPSELFEFGSQG